MVRHGLAAFLLLAILAPLVPLASNPMVCCRGMGQACSCPIDEGFTRCPAPEPASATLQVPPMILPPAPPALELAVSPELLRSASESPVSLSRRPLVPPPRG